MSKKPENEDKMLNLTYQMKQNNEDLKSFLEDLDSWEAEMKQIDSKLKDKKQIEEQKLPPVRNSLEKKKLKKKVKKKKDDSQSKPKRISSYDYRSWDKFDVDKACESVDGDQPASSEGEYETDEEWENERKKQAAVLEKDKGNEYFKKGDYGNAIECYTKGADLDPTNPLLPANRAMALLKQEKYGAAELDCSVALTLDPLYTKAYLRRGSARLGLKKYSEAKADFERVLQLEPQNKKATSDLALIEKEISKANLVSRSDSSVNQSLGVVKAISKHPSQRSQKPLRRLDIEEVGLEEADIKSAVARTEATQSKMKRDIMEREGGDFQRFTANSPADIAALCARNTTVTECLPNGDTQHGDLTDSVHKCDTNRTLDQGSDSERFKPCQAEASLGSVKLVNTDKNENHACSQSGKGVSTSSVSPRETPVPVNSVQFQADYRRLKSDKQAFYMYFKKIPPCDYPKLFGQFLDADVLQTILGIIRDCYIPAGDECMECLQSLTTVKRFSMVVMFMSKKEKQVLLEIFTHLRQSGKSTDTDIDSLTAKYEVR